ncbi:MAG TPA: hypothetical protein VN316_02310 [candidate division Zixibacteria bacterium]|nr:hypothetical protein [candidate division Zixibacteria bacterium]
MKFQIRFIVLLVLIFADIEATTTTYTPNPTPIVTTPVNQSNPIESFMDWFNKLFKM